MTSVIPEKSHRDWIIIVVVWLLLAASLLFLARSNASVPGLNYDETHCAGLAKDFLSGHARPHLVGTRTIRLFGRPFPWVIQSYAGAVKSWLLIPVFALFGASQPVLRWTSLSYGLVALLLFMLWACRWLGRNIALIAGVLLAFDPTFFFISVFDWGPAIPGFLFRFVCLGFALSWWRLANDTTTSPSKASARKTMLHAFLTGLFAGLGFLSKIDFAVLLGSVLLAVLCCRARALWTNIVSRQPVMPALALLGFLLPALPMLCRMPGLLTDLPHADQFEAGEKLDSLLAMYDGSYFYRLMDAGGVFTKMYQGSAPVLAPLGIALVIATVCLFFQYRRRGAFDKDAAILLLSILFITIGIFLLRRAARIHHMVLVYPFPHLVVALVLERFLRRWLAAIVLVLLLSWQLVALNRTQQLIEQTGGRGWWSDAIEAFARQVKDRPDLTIVSLDWGFSEQLAFLTDGPKLVEPFWLGARPMPRQTNCIYLAHPLEYSLFPACGPPLLEQARRAGPDAVEILPWCDHQNRVAFYSMRFRRQ